jgi:hypothetical protein
VVCEPWLKGVKPDVVCEPWLKGVKPDVVCEPWLKGVKPDVVCEPWLKGVKPDICLKLPVFVVICLKNLDNFTKTCMILTQTWAIGLLLNSNTVKHANCYGSSHYFLKILFINHILTKVILE